VPAAISLEPGGQGANVAVRLARRGVPVRLTSALGDGAAARLVRDALAADGVELDDLGADTTGTVVAVIDASGERTMLSQRVPLVERLGGWAARDVEWLVVSGYVLLEPGADHLGMRGDVGRAMVVGCSLGPGEAAAWADAAAGLRPDLTVLNLEEATTIAGSDAGPETLSRDLAARLGGLVVVTTTGGAHVALGAEVVTVARRGGDVAIDTTGAGDALAASLLAALLAQQPWPPDRDRLESALAVAVEAAAAVTRVHGAQGRIAGEPER
jgi:sugar/nucleoside kinase (ribokinase family)